MCLYVGVAPFMALVFNEKKQKKITFAELSKIYKQTEEDLPYDIAIDWTSKSYAYAMDFFADYFEEQKDSIFCKDMKKLKKNINHITDSMPKRCKDEISNSLRKTQHIA